MDLIINLIMGEKYISSEMGLGLNLVSLITGILILIIVKKGL